MLLSFAVVISRFTHILWTEFKVPSLAQIQVYDCSSANVSTLNTVGNWNAWIIQEQIMKHSIFASNKHNKTVCIDYNDVMMSSMASQITSLTIVYSTVYSRSNQRKYQNSASLVFVWGNHRSPVNSPHKGPVTRKMFPFVDVDTILRDIHGLVQYYGNFVANAVLR